MTHPRMTLLVSVRAYLVLELARAQNLKLVTPILSFNTGDALGLLSSALTPPPASSALQGGQ